MSGNITENRTENKGKAFFFTVVATRAHLFPPLPQQLVTKVASKCVRRGSCCHRYSTRRCNRRQSIQQGEILGDFRVTAPELTVRLIEPCACVYVCAWCRGGFSERSRRRVCGQPTDLEVTREGGARPADAARNMDVGRCRGRPGLLVAVVLLLIMLLPLFSSVSGQGKF